MGKSRIRIHPYGHGHQQHRNSSNKGCMASFEGYPFGDPHGWLVPLFLMRAQGCMASFGGYPFGDLHGWLAPLSRVLHHIATPVEKHIDES
jgi:hypothetical protein